MAVRDAGGGTDALLRLEHIRLARRGEDGRERLILDDVCCEAPTGRITAIVGPSGGGKSSLIRLINRLEEPDGGAVYLEGRDIATLDPLRLRGRVALVPQKPFLFEGSVLANLQRPFRYRDLPLPGTNAPHLLRCLELASLSPDLLERDARALSLGEQQRVALARALITSPDALLLDEPTSALDRPTADRLAATLRAVCRRERLAVMMVTHDLRLAERTADYLYFLEGGRIREEGEPAPLFAAPRTPELRRFLGVATGGEEP